MGSESHELCYRCVKGRSRGSRCLDYWLCAPRKRDSFCEAGKSLFSHRGNQSTRDLECRDAKRWLPCNCQGRKRQGPRRLDPLPRKPTYRIIVSVAHCLRFSCKLPKQNGAEGRSRTHTTLRSTDFRSQPAIFIRFSHPAASTDCHKSIKRTAAPA